MKLTMIGRLSECWLLSYAVEPDRVARHLSRGLELATHAGSAFLNIVLCRVERMRPAHTPRVLGLSYWHIAYRLQVRARTASGASIEGLFFLRSDVDTALIGVLGNAFTDFRFHASNVRIAQSEEAVDVRVQWTARAEAEAHVRIAPDASPALLPGSCFSTVEAREAMLEYAPFGLSTTRDARRLKIAEVLRDEAQWREDPVRVVEADWSYARHLDLGRLRLERAMRVAPIDYRWRLGRTEEIAGGATR